MENRRGSLIPPTPLPSDYLKLVGNVFATNFDEGLRALSQVKGTAVRFEASGSIYTNEIVLRISLHGEGELAATTVHGSIDFDPKASSPTIEELLAACVDAIGSLYGQVLVSTQPEKLAQLAEESLSGMENIPFDWSPVEVDRTVVYLKMDKSNPNLDQMADQWLEQNDPDLAERLKREEEETQNLFVTGPRPNKKDIIH